MIIYFINKINNSINKINIIYKINNKIQQLIHNKTEIKINKNIINGINKYLYFSFYYIQYNTN